MISTFSVLVLLAKLSVKSAITLWRLRVIWYLLEQAGGCGNMSNRATTLRRKISVIKSRYPKLRNSQVWERHDRMVAELKKLESDGV